MPFVGFSEASGAEMQPPAAHRKELESCANSLLDVFVISQHPSELYIRTESCIVIQFM